MRVLMLAQSFAPIVGGEERVVEQLSLELAGRGHEVAVATLRQPGEDPVAPGAGVRVHALRSSVGRLSRPGAERIYAPPLPDPETVIDLRRVVNSERPDVVHAHNWILHSYLGIDRRSEAALVYSVHDYGLVCPNKRLFRDGAPCAGPRPSECLRCALGHYGAARGVAAALGTLARRSSIRRQVDLFLPVSSTVARLCGLADERSLVMPNFVAQLPAPPAASDRRLAALPDEPFLLFFGDVTEDKGAGLLAEAHAMLSEPPPLVMIGRRMLARLDAQPGIHLLGPWPHELAIEAVRRSLFSVAPSLWPEPFGMVALEAAAAGKAVVASRIGGLEDIVVHGETGLLVPSGERPALGSALQLLIADDDLRQRMGEAAARRAAESFSPAALVPRVEDAYRVAIESRRARRTG